MEQEGERRAASSISAIVQLQTRWTIFFSLSSFPDCPRLPSREALKLSNSQQVLHHRLASLTILCLNFNPEKGTPFKPLPRH
jgi:hypothetical protein